MFTMTSTANSLQAVTAQIIALLWIFLQGQAQAKIYTSCLGRRYGLYTTTNFCYDRSTTRCCYEKCCDAWDYSYSFTYSSCQSTFGYSYQTCKNGLSTDCCRRSYGGYSTCCYSTNWWSTSSSSTNWWSTSSTTNFWDNSSSRGPSLGGIIGGVFGTIVIVIIIVVVSVICCGHRSAGRRGRVLRGAGNTNAMPIVMAGTQPTATTTVTHQSYPAQPPPGRYPNQYPQGPLYPYPQGGPSYPQEPLQGSAPYPPSTGVYAPPPSYDSALNMQMGSTVPEHRVPNPSESVPSAPYPPGPVDAAPYPTQPAGMPPPPARY